MGFNLELVGTSIGTNQPPTVNAGTNLAIQLPQNAQLNGAAMDDGLPLSPGILQVNWMLLSGPGNVAFANSNSAPTTASFSVPGNYSLRLTASDGIYSSFADVTVDVLAETYESWAASQFSPEQLGNPGISGGAADPDEDGFTNDEEFVAGTNPLDGESYLRIEQINLEPPGNAFSFQFIAAPRRTYSVQFRNVLDGGGWNTLTNLSAEAVPRTIVVSNSVATPDARYYRIIALAP
jgi:hypothetical protein